jgi:Trk K+ transport system NAD-binding subunit
MHGALIMTAVLSCILSPVLFNRVFPFRSPSKPVVAIVGANHITLPVSHELSQEGYRVKLFSTDSHSKEMDKGNGERIPVINVDVTDEQKMNEAGLFKADVIVFGTMDDELNVRLAEYARAVGVKRIIVRAEDPKWQEKVSSDETFALMSTLYASRILLRLMIDSPIAVKMIAHQDDSIREIHVQNRYYHNMLLRDLALPQNVLVLRIFRGDTFITPHGLTQIKYGDRLLVSGPAESIGAIQEQMEQS